MTFTASDAWQATEYLNQLPFDLLISDAKMPHVSGFDLIQTIRKDHKFKDLSIAMLTGLRDKKDITRAIEVGVDDYIVKPIDPLILIEKINALFEKKPPQNHPQAFLADSSELSPCEIHLKSKLISISELGVCIHSSLPLEPGSTLTINASFFNELGAEPPLLKVLNCSKIDNHFESQLIFLGATEKFLQKIRAWIFSHGSRRMQNGEKKTA